jgi:hypothetical protein
VQVVILLIVLCEGEFFFFSKWLFWVGKFIISVQVNCMFKLITDWVCVTLWTLIQSSCLNEFCIIPKNMVF